MKKLTLLLLLICSVTFAQPVKPYTFGPGDPISSAKINSNFDLLYDWASGPANAATLGGYSASTSAAAANTIPVRDASGYLYLGWINTVSGDRGTTAPTRIYASNDGFIRYYTPDNFKSVMGLIHTGNFQSTNTSGVINPNNTTMNGLYYCNSVSLFGQTDGALYNQAHSSTWQGQIYQDYRTGQLAIRGKNSGTWQAWRTVRDSTNFVAGTGSTNYCAGNDARLSDARTPLAHNQDGSTITTGEVPAARITSRYANYAAPFNTGAGTPRSYSAAGMAVCFVSGTGWPISYGMLLNIPSYTASEDGGAMQILIPYSQSYTNGGRFMFRIGGYTNKGWVGGWRTVSHDGKIIAATSAPSSPVNGEIWVE